MNRSPDTTHARHRQRVSPALAWARLLAVLAVVLVGTYLLCVGIVATAIAWGWSA
ncbi:hypothetical protein [Tomitella gaofuii]|uniref:hypothetical protein n=1 Tax=Tomitella gaofuii TaxID=2760083 RepID=UPI0015FBE494|nr:hypothetical protein [Tomitella gaofuii]